MIDKIKKIVELVFLYSFLVVYNLGLSQNKSPKYDFTCFQENEIEASNYNSSEMEQGLLRTFGDKVSLKEEVDFGKDVYLDTKKHFKFIEDEFALNKLQTILKKLIKSICHPRGLN